MWNVHRMFITHIQITLESRNIKKTNLRLLSSGTKLFITFELKGFSTWGRERHKPSLTTYPSAPPPSTHPLCEAPAARPRRAPKVNRLLRTLKLNSDFSQIPEILSPHFRCVTSFPSSVSYLRFLLWHLWMTRPLRTRVNTCAHVYT